LLLSTKYLQHNRFHILPTGFGIYRISDPDSTELPLTVDYFKENKPSATAGVYKFARQVSARFKLEEVTVATSQMCHLTCVYIHRYT
jgi:hypothetical protein